MKAHIFEPLTHYFRSTWASVLVLAALLALTLAQAWQRGAPVAMADATAATLPCVSYAPFHRAGSTPMTPDGAVSAEQIEHDLRRLKGLTDCVRTYGVANGLHHVPSVARKLGMRVRQGVWLGRDEAANRVEIDRAVALAETHRDVIDVLIVGNEVLLRRDLSVEQLTHHLRHVKSRINIAITYADVWEFWQRHAELKAEVDWVTVHILPYWEDIPVAAKDAADHVFNIAHDMQKLFANKPIWVGETGWPAAGRQRAGARPGVVEQTLLIRQLASRAASAGVSINIIEAFDQPWKRALEGAMGGAWGLFAADGVRRVYLSGDVIEGGDTGHVFVVTGAGFLLALSLLALIARRVGPLRSVLPHHLTASLGVALLCATVVLHGAFTVLWSRTLRERVDAVVIAAVVIVATAVMLWVQSSAPSQSIKRARCLAWARIALLFIAASWALILIADPRYRGFPIALFALPAALSVGLIGVPIESESLRYESLFLALALVLAAALMVVQEGVANTEALALAGCWLLLAAPFILRAIARPGQRHAREQ
jgi:exo-beta-1,3-glucanase (GH17 family)